MRANLKLNPNLADNEYSEDETGSNSAGQSGDIQGISDVADADSESVEELVEEGNSFEAAAVEGVENAKDPDVSEVTTRQVPEDDVPEEYRKAD
jgi:hypothetical protein